MLHHDIDVRQENTQDQAIRKEVSKHIKLDRDWINCLGKYGLSRNSKIIFTEN